MTLLFATDSHHLVIAALNDSYAIFSPGELMPSGDVAALATRAFAAAFKIGMQLSAPFLVFGLVFNIGLGVLARLMPQMQVYFVGVPLSILAGFLIFAARHRGDDGNLPRLLHRRHARADAAELRDAAMADENDTDDKTEDPTQKRLDDAHRTRRRRQEPGGQHLVRDRGRDAGARRRSPDRSAAAFRCRCAT